MVRDEIEAVNRQWSEALANGDASAIAGLYTEDGKILAPNAEPVEGRAAIEAFVKEFIASGARSLRLDTAEVDDRGDLAVELGRYTLAMEPPGAGPMTDVGKYVVVWHRQADGAWRLNLDMFSTNQPAP